LTGDVVGQYHIVLITWLFNKFIFHDRPKLIDFMTGTGKKNDFKKEMSATIDYRIWMKHLNVFELRVLEQ